MPELKDKQGNMENFTKIGTVSEDFYSELYSSQTDDTTLIEIESEEDTEVPRITADEVKKSCPAVKRQLKTA